MEEINSVTPRSIPDGTIFSFHHYLCQRTPSEEVGLGRVDEELLRARLRFKNGNMNLLVFQWKNAMFDFFVERWMSSLVLLCFGIFCSIHRRAKTLATVSSFEIGKLKFFLWQLLCDRCRENLRSCQVFFYSLALKFGTESTLPAIKFESCITHRREALWASVFVKLSCSTFCDLRSFVWRYIFLKECSIHFSAFSEMVTIHFVKKLFSSI